MELAYRSRDDAGEQGRRHRRCDVAVNMLGKDHACFMKVDALGDDAGPKF